MKTKQAGNTFTQHPSVPTSPQQLATDQPMEQIGSGANETIPASGFSQSVAPSGFTNQQTVSSDFVSFCGTSEPVIDTSAPSSQTGKLSDFLLRRDNPNIGRASLPPDHLGLGNVSPPNFDARNAAVALKEHVEGIKNRAMEIGAPEDAILSVEANGNEVVVTLDQHHGMLSLNTPEVYDSFLTETLEKIGWEGIDVVIELGGEDPRMAYLHDAQHALLDNMNEIADRAKEMKGLELPVVSVDIKDDGLQVTLAYNDDLYNYDVHSEDYKHPREYTDFLTSEMGRIGFGHTVAIVVTDRKFTPKADAKVANPHLERFLLDSMVHFENADNMIVSELPEHAKDFKEFRLNGGELKDGVLETVLVDQPESGWSSGEFYIAKSNMNGDSIEPGSTVIHGPFYHEIEE